MTYDSNFFDAINPGSRRSAEVVVPLIMDLLRPATVIDVGCGEGIWLSVFRDKGCTIQGIDGEHVTPKIDRFTAVDLASDWSFPGRFDLAVSLEVAEHLPAAVADRFIANLTALSDVVLFSAAIPGQGGVGHINCQWPSYWHPKFAAHGYQCYDALRWLIWNDDRVEPWYRQNLLVFAKPGTIPFDPGFLGALDVVHPKIWSWYR